MQLTRDFLYEKFNDFNKLFFNKKLPLIKIKIIKSKKDFGYFLFHSYKDSMNNRIVICDEIAISNYYEQTDIEYTNTLLHEMIHYYIAYENKELYLDSHGKRFKEIMKMINASNVLNKVSINGTVKNLKKYKNGNKN